MRGRWWVAALLSAQWAAALNDYWGVFCGKQDCYELLGVEREASIKDIKKAYRSLSLIHHPDKASNKDDATATFQSISKAYRVLSDDESRKLYDYYVEHPSEYWIKYGHVFYRTYVPQSDLKVAVLLLLLLASAMTWGFQYSRYAQACREIVAMVMRGQAKGVTPEILELRRLALERYECVKQAQNSPGVGESKEKVKKKRLEDDPMFLSCVRATVAEAQIEVDGCSRPTLKDVLVVRLALWLLHTSQRLWLRCKLECHERFGTPMSVAEKASLLERDIGHKEWEALAEEDRGRLIEQSITYEELLQSQQATEQPRQRKGRPKKGPPVAE